MTDSLQLTQSGRDVEVMPVTGHITGLVTYGSYACYGEHQRRISNMNDQR